MQQSPLPSRRNDLLALMNGPLMLTAAAECLAGGLTVSFSTTLPPYLTALGSALIFGAGSVFGHYFDREQDRREHPERPLPSGRVDLQTAWRGGLAMLIAGLVLCFSGGTQALTLGIGAAMAVVLYSAVTRRIWGLSFLTLGAAHALNLAVGLSVEQGLLQRYGAALLAMAFYGAGWGVLRASRQPGTPPTTGFVALVHLAGAASALVFAARTGFTRPWEGMPFVAAFVGLCYPRFVNAVMDPRRPPAVEAVQYGLLGFTLLSAALAGGYAGILAGLLPALLLIPQYFLLSRWPVSLVTTPR